MLGYVWELLFEIKLNLRLEIESLIKVFSTFFFIVVKLGDEGMEGV